MLHLSLSPHSFLHYYNLSLDFLNCRREAYHRAMQDHVCILYVCVWMAAILLFMCVVWLSAWAVSLVYCPCVFFSVVCENWSSAALYILHTHFVICVYVCERDRDPFRKTVQKYKLTNNRVLPMALQQNLQHRIDWHHRGDKHVFCLLTILSPICLKTGIGWKNKYGF